MIRAFNRRLVLVGGDYYYCTGYKGKCDEPYTREEVLERQFTAVLKSLVITESILKWLDHELTFSIEQDERIRQRTVKSWQDDWDRLQARLDAMYEDKLDGRITPEQFDRKAKDTRSKQQALRTKISEHQTNHTDLRAGFNVMRQVLLAANLSGKALGNGKSFWNSSSAQQFGRRIS